jgi:hypothetical protein
MTTIELIRLALENAKGVKGIKTDELVGWSTREGDVICSDCVGKLQSLNLEHPDGMKSIWKNTANAGACRCAICRTKLIK